MTETSKLNDLEPYLPSSSEKKQAVMMYMVVGLVLSMGKWEVSPYTHHHIKQSLGWVVFLVLVGLSDFLLIIMGLIWSLFLRLAFLITLPILTVGVMGIYQAQQGKYIWESELVNKFFMMFSGVGNRVLNLFEANHYQIVDADMYRGEEQFYGKPDNINSNDNSAQNVQNQTNSVDLETIQGTQNYTDVNVQTAENIQINENIQYSGENQITMNSQPIENLKIVEGTNLMNEQQGVISLGNVPQEPSQTNNTDQINIESSINGSIDNNQNKAENTGITSNNLIDNCITTETPIDGQNIGQNNVIGGLNSLDNNPEISINNGSNGIDLSDLNLSGSNNSVQN